MNTNNQKLAFIICVNNELYFSECQYYISQLKVPENFEVEVLGIREATSMCAAYNLGMQSSDAKYKVYMHQDVFIRNNNFIEDIIAIFENDSTIGMIGMMGGNKMPKTGVTYRAWNVGVVDCREPDMAYYLVCDPEEKEDIVVEAIDGLMIVTQYDIPWREDFFKHFDFYDISQSFEMRKKGYKILVPYQKEPWTIHDSSFVKLTYYNEARLICLEQYSEFLYADGGFQFIYDKEWNDMSDLLAEQVKVMIANGQWDEVKMAIESYRNAGKKSSTLETLAILYDIYEQEKKGSVKSSFFEECTDYQSIYKKYTILRFFLRRMELQMEPEAYAELVECMKGEQISREALVIIVLHSIADKKVVFKRLAEIYHSYGRESDERILQQLYDILKEKAVPIAYTRRATERKE